MSLIFQREYIWNVAIAIISAVMIASIWFREDQTLSRLLSLWPLPWLGRLTYAIYLLQTIAINIAEAGLRKLHLPETGWLLFIAGYALSVGLAWLAHTIIERPLIDRGKRLSINMAQLSPTK